MATVPLPLAQFVLSGLNHVLRQQPALRESMRAHAGRELRIVVSNPLSARTESDGRPVREAAGLLHSDARIGPDGLLAVVTEARPDATLTLTPGIDALFGALREGPLGLGNHLRIEGDVMLAAAIGQVARSFRWDVEEDLSRVVGDAVAHRIGQAFRDWRGQADGLGVRSREAAQRYVASDRGPLVTAEELDAFGQALRALSDRIGRLETPAPLTARG